MIRAYFKSTKFPLNSPTQVTTITGMEEGIGEWLTVNYVLGNFQVKKISFFFEIIVKKSYKNAVIYFNRIHN